MAHREKSLVLVTITFPSDDVTRENQFHDFSEMLCVSFAERYNKNLLKGPPHELQVEGGIVVTLL